MVPLAKAHRLGPTKSGSNVTLYLVTFQIRNYTCLAGSTNSIDHLTSTETVVKIRA